MPDTDPATITPVALAEQLTALADRLRTAREDDVDLHDTLDDLQFELDYLARQLLRIPKDIR